MLGQKTVKAPRCDEELEDESEGRGSVSADYPSSKPDFASRRAEKTVTAAVSSSSSDEDDELSYFQKLAEE